MDTLLPKLFYSAYRKEPISAFILIMGVVDGLLGGFNHNWTLLSLGLLLVVTSAAVRWLQIQKAQNSVSQQTPRRYLPPSKSKTALPILKSKNYQQNKQKS
jgi:hypothetical protein